jgi:hypothetical protein
MVGEYEVIGFSNPEKLGLGVERLKDFQACCVQRGCAPAFLRFADGDREGTVNPIDVLPPQTADWLVAASIKRVYRQRAGIVLRL